MKNLLGFLVMFVGVFYIVHYESYTWNPCSGATCLTINCGLTGCVTPERQFTCDTKDCVRDILNKNGLSHLTGVFEIDLDSKSIEKLEVIPSYDVKEKEKYGNLTGTGTLSSDSIVNIKIYLKNEGDKTK